jgi:peptidoglycan/xylan/chitin deacetylase (PgdA/CDA1 family)
MGYHKAMEGSQKYGHLVPAIITALATLVCNVTEAIAEPSAVVFMYHRFAEGEHPSTNITLEQFDAHIKELTSGAYTVLPIIDIVTAMREGKPLPDRTVGISIDDAYLSVYQKAWPRLRKAGFPFTLFATTDAADHGLSGSMNWEQIIEMSKDGLVTIGAHSASHLHMADASTPLNEDEIERAALRFEEKLGFRPTLFAYPYGEARLTTRETVIKTGHSAAFGQHSGVIGSTNDFYYLPRFAMNEKYGGLERFRLAANALALPVEDITPQNFTIDAAHNPPAIGFSVRQDISGLEQLSCFSSHEGNVSLTRLGTHRIEVRMKTPFPKGRTRMNCTLPAGEGRWRWFGRQFYVP